MKIKLNFRRSLLYLSLNDLTFYLRTILLVIMEKYISFLNSILLAFLMSLGEIFGGLSVHLIVRNTFRKKKYSYLKEKLFKDRKKKARPDGWTKRIILIFFAAFFDFVEFIILNSYIFNVKDISDTMNVRFSAITTISSSLLCIYCLKFKTGKHKVFSMISMGIFLVFQFLVEMSFSTDYIKFLQVFIIIVLHLVFITFNDVIERYLADTDFPNPFGIIMGEGIFTFILTFIYAIVSKETNVFKEIKQIYNDESTGKFGLLIFLLFLYFLLSAVLNVYKIYCNVVLSPMAKSLIEYLFNPVYIIFSFFFDNDFLFKGESNALFFLINEILSFVFIFFGFVYNEYIILYCYQLEYDTNYGISIRAIESIKGDTLDDLKEEAPILNNEDDDDDNKENIYNSNYSSY